MSDKPRGYADRVAGSRRQPDASPAPLDGQTAGSPAAPEVPGSQSAGVSQPQSTPADSGNEDSFKTTNPPRRQKHVRLNFILNGGKEFSLPYIDLRPIEFEPTVGIVLKYVGLCTVTLTGRNLKKLKRRLDREEVGTIQEVDEFAEKALGNEKATAVYSIKTEDATRGDG